VEGRDIQVGVISVDGGTRVDEDGIKCFNSRFVVPKSRKFLGEYYESPKCFPDSVLAC